MTYAEQILRESYFTSYVCTKLIEITEFLYSIVVCDLSNDSKKKILEMNRCSTIAEIDSCKEEKIVQDLLKNVLAAKTREAIKILTARYNRKGFLSNSSVKKILRKNSLEVDSFKWLPYQRIGAGDVSGMFYYVYAENGEKKLGRKRIEYEN